jgi:hypothetical protein
MNPIGFAGVYMSKVFQVDGSDPFQSTVVSFAPVNVSVKPVSHYVFDASLLELGLATCAATVAGVMYAKMVTSTAARLSQPDGWARQTL